MATLIREELEQRQAATSMRSGRFRQYYQFYLTQHQNKNCRRLHLFGMVVALGLIAWLATTSWWWLACLAPLAIYPFAWIGHFYFERNTPATFRNPLFAALSDFVMTWDILRGRLTIF
jgi:hypothetical protein